MKPASTALANLIDSGEFDAWETFTFALPGGGYWLLSTAPIAISSAETTWPANGPIVTDKNQQRAHSAVGTGADTWKVPVAARPKDSITGEILPDRIGDQPLLAALKAGLIESADVIVRRAYFDPRVLTYPGAVGGRIPVGFLTMFRGLVDDVDLSRAMAVITLKDYRVLFDTPMPRNMYQAGCEHTLFDSGCKLLAANFRESGAVTGVVSRSILSTNAPAPGGSGTYALGRIAMTSGRNAGIVRMIHDWDGASTIMVTPPFPFLVEIGDTANLYPGCDKTEQTCIAFGNRDNFGGDPFIPPPTTTGS